MTSEDLNTDGHGYVKLEHTFQNLLKISLAKKYSPLTFQKLINDFKNKLVDTKLDITPLFINCQSSHLQRDYIYQILVASDIQDTCEEFINYFNQICKNISAKDQILILLLFNQNSDDYPWKTYIQNNQVLNAFSNYLKYIIEIYIDDDEDSKKIIFLTTKFLKNVFSASSKIKLNNNFIQSISAFLEWINSKGLNDSYILLNNELSDYNLSSIKLEFNDSTSLTTNPITSTSSLNDSNSILSLKSNKNEKESIKLLALKKIVWLSQKVTIEFVKFDDKFIIDFKSLINLSHVSTGESISIVATELLTGLFRCLELSSSQNIIIWREYIVSKLPWLLKNVLKINQIKMEKVLESFMKLELKNLSLYDSILAEFEYNLIELELIKPNSVRICSKSLIFENQNITLDDLNHKYTNKFIECNPEFTSIEEIGIVEFLNDVNKSIKLKYKFSELFIESVNSFILTGETLKLRRLLISASINFDLLDYILMFESPYEFLTPLLKFLENHVVRKPQSLNDSNSDRYSNQTNQNDFLMDLDIGGDDSSNVQDFFSDLSTVLVFIQFIIVRYSLILKQNELPLIPNTLSLLNNSKLINADDISTIKLDDDTINKWISSMFDSSNVDGISDNLIKMSTPLEYSQLLPRIINEAIICRKIGWLDNDALIGGLEYLHEKFLVGWISYIIDECCNLKWSNNEGDSNLDDVLDLVLKQLLTINEKESIDIQMIIKLVKYTVNDKIWNAFPNMRELLNEPPKNISLNESFSNIIRLVISNDRSSSKYEFDLSLIWKCLLNKRLVVDCLYEELVKLTNETHMITELSYDLTSILLITFSKWMVGNSIITKWPIGLAQINENYHNSTNKIEYLKKCSKLIFTRKSEKLEMNVYPDSKKIQEAQKKMDSGFFGFLQDPNSDDSSINNNKNDEIEMDIDSKNDDLFEIDIYGANLFFLAFENQRNPITETFQRKIITYLS